MRSQAARRLRLAKFQSIPRLALSSPYSSSSRKLQPRRPVDPSTILKADIDAARTPIPEDASPAELIEFLRGRARVVTDSPKNDPATVEPEEGQTSHSGSPPDPGSEADSVPARRTKPRRTRLVMDKEKEPEPELPPRPTLDSKLIHKILWTAPKSSNPSGNGEPSGSSPASHSESSSNESSTLGEGLDPKLPPPYILDEVEHKLRVILHPHAQINGLRKPDDGDWRSRRSVVEPTLALFCPIEGGNHVIDATVEELSRRVDADVIVIDAVQLAAGLNGAYGEASSAFQFSPNPLHSAAPTKDFPAANGPTDEEGSPAVQMMSAPSLSIQVPPIALGPFADGAMLRPSRSSPMSKRRTDRMKMRYFFDALLHAPSAPPEEGERRPYSRPRLIYIRDFEFLAASGSSWYPQLLRAVQELRQGNDPSSDIVNQVAVVFGLSPALVMYRQPDSTSPASATSPSRQKPNPTQSEQESDKPDDPGRAILSTDEEAGAKFRDKGIKSWLKDWDQYGEDAIRDELPWFDPYNSESSSRGGSLAKIFGGAGDGVRVMGSIPNMPDLRDQITRMVRAMRGDPTAEESSEDDDSQYFSVAAVMPSVRQPGLELSERLQRRKEINQLAFRTVLRNMGGIIPGQVDEYVLPRSTDSLDNATVEEHNGAEVDASRDPTRLMFSEWEGSLVDRETLREVAVRALGQSMAARVEQIPANSESSSIAGAEERDPALTTVTWGSVALAWRQWFLNGRRRKEWIAHQRRKSTSSKEPGAAEQGPSDDAAPEVDELIERVKSDPSLDAHEKRLLGCIVDTTAVPTTFANVHLPVKTVDAIRTMVSLPLLYPKAFSEGVLKNHSMTGALLLGPPGVGKTLLARAVARESGARMLMIKPSDVMDMYVGEGEKLVKSVFSLARRLSPCVIFLDEVDALLASRISSRESGSAIAHRSVITEFMQEMDGLRTNKAQGSVIVIGATNRPFDLDDAVLRRLPRRLLIDLPGEKERLEILKIHLRDESLAPDVNLSMLAKQTEMYSGSDLKNLCVAAALDAVKESVELPWLTGATNGAQSILSEQDDPRLLHERHFAKALTEVTPSSSESLGTLHDLRKWNEEFGEGRIKNGGRKSKWGEKFGFGGKDSKDVDGRVMANETAA